MNVIMTKNALGILLVLTLCAGEARAQKTLYENNFEQSAPGQVPADFLVLDGGFAVQQSEGNKYLELPGEPLDNFGLLFGPATNAGVRVSARIQGTAKGRRYPSFGVGLNGPSGFKLKVAPSKNALELDKGDDALATVPYNWKSGVWTMFQLRVRPAGPGTWKVEGKAWPQSEAEPKDWMLAVDEKTEPHPGRAALWGSPYAGTPIRFDDLQLTAE
jgi:hypothetical protein